MFGDVPATMFFIALTGCGEAPQRPGMSCRTPSCAGKLCPHRSKESGSVPVHDHDLAGCQRDARHGSRRDVSRALVPEPVDASANPSLGAKRAGALEFAVLVLIERFSRNERAHGEYGNHLTARIGEQPRFLS